MKKRLVSWAAKISILISVLSGVMLIGISDAYAQQPGTFSRFTVPERCNQPGVECGWNELLALGGEFLKFGIFLAVLGSTVVFIIAGFKMIANKGSSGEISKAKDMMTKAVIGIIVTMIAWLIVTFILNQLGVSGQFRSFI